MSHLIIYSTANSFKKANSYETRVYEWVIESYAQPICLKHNYSGGVHHKRVLKNSAVALCEV